MSTVSTDHVFQQPTDIPNRPVILKSLCNYFGKSEMLLQGNPRPRKEHYFELLFEVEHQRGIDKYKLRTIWCGIFVFQTSEL